MISERLIVPSIHCSSCETYLRSALSELPHLRDITIDSLQHSLTFVLDSRSASEHGVDSLVKAVQRVLDAAGYPSYRSTSSTTAATTETKTADVEAAGVNEVGRSATAPVRPWWDLRRFSRRVGQEKKNHARHLEHCEACRLESVHDPARSEKGEGTSLSLDAVKVDRQEEKDVYRTELAIEGMTCSSCSSTITRQVESLPGITSASVNLVLNSAVIVHVPEITSSETLVKEIEDIGYGATVVSSVKQKAEGKMNSKAKRGLKKTTFGLEGMTCSSCSGTITSAVSALEGVSSVSVSLLANSMEVIHDPLVASNEKVIEAVDDVGYSAEVWKSEDVRGNDTEEERNDKVDVRTVQILVEGFCEACPSTVTKHLESLPLISFTPITQTHDICTLTYIPSPTLSIRQILTSPSLPPPLSLSLYTPPSLSTRSREMQAREAAHLTRLFGAAFVLAVPTFVIGVVGMDLVKKGASLRAWCERPIWGGAMRGVVALWVLASLMQVGVNRIFFQRAYKSLAPRHGAWHFSRFIHFGNMDLLVALSTFVAYVASLAMMIRDIVRGADEVMRTGSSTYFDSCVFLGFFILMGRVLEGRAKVKTGDAISLLGGMLPETAQLVTPNEKDSDKLDPSAPTTTIPVHHIDLGDHLLLPPGSLPPADGVLVSGSSTFDESSLTGEFMPVPKSTPGDAIMTGTTNLSSPIIMRVTSVGDSTMLQKIVHAVSEGQSRKAPIEKMADRITAVFIPIVIYLSLLVLLIWLSLALSHSIPESYLPGGRTGAGDRAFFAVQFAISTLVIACPCGIGLAAPTAQAVGAGMAAKAGILAQGGGEAFQIAAGVDAVVFDKTGTLTMGEAVVVDELLAVDDEKGEEWVKSAAGVVEGRSSHPLARAIVKWTEETKADDDERAVEIVESEEIPGRGLRATFVVRKSDGTSSTRTIYIGNERFVMDDHHAQLSESLSTRATSTVQDWKSNGHSVVCIAISTPSKLDNQDGCSIYAFLAIADTIRPSAAEMIASLRSSGREVFMLTGDNATTALAVASKLGIPNENVKAGVLPHEKAEFIGELQDRRREERRWRWGKTKEKKTVVAFCGDGLNDSAALTRADVGIALAHGSQVTIASASFVLLSPTHIPSSLLTLLSLSRAVFNRQKMNFGWALVYNLILIPIAAGVLYPYKNTSLPPVWSALAMALSSVSVVGSSLALQWGL